jgi:hypothetical protein
MDEPVGNKSTNQAAMGFLYISATSTKLHYGEN